MESKSELGLYALQVQSGTGNELRVYFSLEAKQLIFPESGSSFDVRGAGHQEVGYLVHPLRDSTDLAVEIYDPQPASGSKESDELGTGTEVVFTLCHPQAEKYGVSQLTHRKPARREEVEPVLFAAARWNWHLKRTNESARSSSMVSVEMMKLYEIHRNHPAPVEGPLVNLNRTGVVELTVKGQDLYGFRLSSQASVPLYFQVVYFDATDFSISMSSNCLSFTLR